MSQQQSQFNSNRLNGFGGNVNGILQINNNKGPKINTRQQVTRSQGQQQVQPLSASQLANIQQGDVNSLGRFKNVMLTTEAQYARAKLSSKKSFNLEDDLEFYPNQIETRSRSQQQSQQASLNSRMVMGSPMSPYSTPTKPVVFNGAGQQQQVHRMGYMSPAQAMNSPQQQQPQRVLNHSQIFTSPQNLSNVRRLDLSNVSPMYQNSPSVSRNW